MKDTLTKRRPARNPEGSQPHPGAGAHRAPHHRVPGSHVVRRSAPDADPHPRAHRPDEVAQPSDRLRRQAVARRGLDQTRRDGNERTKDMEDWESRAIVLAEDNDKLQIELASARKHLQRTHDRIDELEKDLRDNRAAREMGARRAALEYVGRTQQKALDLDMLDKIAAWVLTGARS